MFAMSGFQQATCRYTSEVIGARFLPPIPTASNSTRFGVLGLGRAPTGDEHRAGALIARAGRLPGSAQPVEPAIPNGSHATWRRSGPIQSFGA